MAHWPKAKAVFAVPVLSLLIAGLFTVMAIVRSGDASRKTTTDIESVVATNAVAANGL
jgi:hypothetical protein